MKITLSKPLEYALGLSDAQRRRWTHRKIFHFIKMPTEQLKDREKEVGYRRNYIYVESICGRSMTTMDLNYEVSDYFKGRTYCSFCVQKLRKEGIDPYGMVYEGKNIFE